MNDLLGIIISLAVIVFFVGGLWRVFGKAGKPGILALIPIVNTIILLDIAGKPWWWIILLIIPVVNVIVVIITLMSLAKAFGQDELFGCLLVLFAPVMFLVLGWGSYEYKGRPA